MAIGSYCIGYFWILRLSISKNPQLEEEEILTAASVATYSVLRELSELVQERHPNAYLANLFKNTQKCKNLDHRLSNPNEAEGADPDPDDGQFDLFQG